MGRFKQKFEFPFVVLLLMERREKREGREASWGGRWEVCVCVCMCVCGEGGVFCFDLGGAAG